MKFDFSKPAPQAQSIQEAQQIINALWDNAIDSQTTELALNSKITDLEEKLNTNSNNSSISPSLDSYSRPFLS